MSSPPTKKRKLPTIKKNKLPAPAPAPTSSTTTPAPASPRKSPPTEPSADLAQKVPQRTPAALLGNADFDLRKPSVYAELFKPPGGGSTPLSGLNRRERDAERRKELAKLRDEARAKRAAEAKYHFDLQGQADKIARFEERLRREKNAVLFPNFLGAKFKDDWERRRRRESRDAGKDNNARQGN